MGCAAWREYGPRSAQDGQEGPKHVRVPGRAGVPGGRAWYALRSDASSITWQAGRPLLGVGEYLPVTRRGTLADAFYIGATCHTAVGYLCLVRC